MTIKLNTPFILLSLKLPLKNIKMKKIRFLLHLGLVLVLISCNQNKSEEKTGQELTEIQKTSESQTDLHKDQESFWNTLLEHCGKAYQGNLQAEPAPDDFEGMELKMYVMSCEKNTIKIPFYVGEDRSRTWVLTKTDNGILLKHDHRLEDGSDDEITMYGGQTSNSGSAEVQYFPADQETTDMLPDASANLWWIGIDEKQFSYNLRRVTTPNLFSVVFDLENPIAIPKKPWGHV